jgi:hypothetical protein
MKKVRLFSANNVPQFQSETCQISGLESYRNYSQPSEPLFEATVVVFEGDDRRLDAPTRECRCNL